MKTTEQRLAALEKDVRWLKKVLASAKALAYTEDMENDPKVTGRTGGLKRMAKLTKEQRRELAKKAAAARWGQK